MASLNTTSLFKSNMTALTTQASESPQLNMTVQNNFTPTTQSTDPIELAMRAIDLQNVFLPDGSESKFEFWLGEIAEVGAYILFGALAVAGIAIKLFKARQLSKLSEEQNTVDDSTSRKSGNSQQSPNQVETTKSTLDLIEQSNDFDNDQHDLSKTYDFSNSSPSFSSPSSPPLLSPPPSPPPSSPHPSSPPYSPSPPPSSSSHSTPPVSTHSTPPVSSLPSPPDSSPSSSTLCPPSPPPISPSPSPPLIVSTPLPPLSSLPPSHPPISSPFSPPSSAPLSSSPSSLSPTPQIHSSPPSSSPCVSSTPPSPSHSSTVPP